MPPYLIYHPVKISIRVSASQLFRQKLKDDLLYKFHQGMFVELVSKDENL